MSRYIFEKHNGKIPAGFLVRHTCDNRACINPKHLILGTYKQNSEDMCNRNRQVKGEDHYKSKLTDKKVKKLRWLYATGKYTYKELAKIFNVGLSTVKHAGRGTTWKHI